MKFFVLYRRVGQVWSTGPFTDVDTANLQAKHLKESGFEGVTVSAEERA